MIETRFGDPAPAGRRASARQAATCPLVAGLLGLLLLAQSCSPGDTTPDGVVRRDSAGVEILEYSSAAIDASPLYTVSDSFDLAIGAADGEAPYVFGRIGAAAELSDGTIMIVDAQAMEARFFSSDGTFVRAVGGRGEGPGEMQYVDGWWLAGGDTVLAWDTGLGRLVTIADRGETFDVLKIETRGGSPDYFMGKYPDGALLFWHQYFEPATDGGRTQYSASIRTRPAAAGEPWPVDTIFRHGAQLPREGAGRPLFRSRTTGGIHPDGAWIATGTEPQIQLYDTAGALRRIVRWEESDRTVTPAHVEAYIAAALENVPPDQHARRRQSIEAQPVPARLPSVALAISQMSGRAWVFRFEPPGEDVMGEILVFSPDGELEVRIDGWEGVEPLPRTLDTVLLRGTDDVGAPRVTRHRFVRERDGG